MIKLFSLVVLIGFISCGQNNSATAPVSSTPSTADTSKPAKSFDDVVFASKKDPVCGMPVKAGVEDTVHYKGGVYGFCAAECKEEFVKEPEKFLKEGAKKEMK